MISLKEAFEEINKSRCFGYSPTASNTKPAHIANGWFRRVLGKRYDPVLLNKTVIQWSKGTEENPSETLLADHPSIFEPFQPLSKRKEFAEFRSDLKLLVSPFGGAVNKGNRQSSYNITCERHLTDDFSDHSVGAFLHQLTMSSLGSGPSPVVGLLTDILRNPKDEVSTITAPLVSEARAVDVAVGTYPAASVFQKRGKRFLSPTIQMLREGFDNLARFEQNYGGGLDALRRLVSFGVFAVLLHMTNRQREMDETPGLNPLLLFFSDRQRDTAYQASNATYNLARRSIDSLYTTEFRVWLEPRIGQRPTVKRCENFANELDFGKDNENRREQLLKSYRSFASQMGGLDAMAEALRETYFRNLTATPLEFYRILGVRIGFLRPGGQPKYFTLDGVLLETVLASIIPEGEKTFRQFLDDLYSRYGLLTGGRSEDSEILMQSGIGHATVQHLRANALAFRHELLSLGWARQFADGVLIVNVPEVLR